MSAAAGGKKRGRGGGGGAGGAEYVSLDGLRLDGRRAGEVRKIRCACGALARADGSAYYEQGNTRVLAAVYGPREPASRGRMQHDRAVVFAEVSSAAFAAPGRRRARKGDRRSVDMAAVVKSIFEGVILLKVLPRTQIDIYVQVLQDDGGALVAAVNAASVALVDAGIPMSDLVVACSVGYVDEQFVVDLNAAEAAADGPELTMAVLGHSGKVSSFQMESRMPNVGVLEQALEHGTAAAKQIFHVLDYELKRQALKLLDSRGVIAF
jgi:exosome complex component RRP41